MHAGLAGFPPHDPGPTKKVSPLTMLTREISAIRTISAIREISAKRNNDYKL